MNHHPLEQFGELAVKSLPAGRGVMLSDNPDKLVVFEAALSRGEGAADWLAVETHELPTVLYRARLEQRLPAGWLTDQTRHELTPLETLRLLEQVARTNRLFYLHPSFGHFFEGFYLEPTGTIYELKRRGKDPLDVPPLTSAALDAKEQFWTRLWDQEMAAAALPPFRASGWANKLARFGVSPAPREQDRLLGEWYSIPLEDWGVTLQKQGRLRAAQTRFQQALRLNANNPSARISLACNTNLQAGIKLGLANPRRLADQLGNADRLNLIMELGGPFDEPTACYVLGSVYVDHNMLVQAAEQMERVRALVPDSLAPGLALAEIYNQLQMPDRSRPLVNHMRDELRKVPAQDSVDRNSLDLDLALLESNSWLLQTNLANARGALQALSKQHPDDPQIAGRVVAAYLALSDVTNALQVVEARLAKAPDDVPSLKAKAMILLQSGQAAAALPLLEHVLAITNQPGTQIEHAFARIANHDFVSAESEFKVLEKNGVAPGMVDYGLALVAEHVADTNLARNYFQLCLSNTPAGAPLQQQAIARLLMLKATAK
jgi:tetratricopeptide (TPR) repeat protein